MKRIIILIITMMALTMISPALALDQCEEPISPGEQCQMITPVINCEGNYDYTIINETNNTIETGNLTSYEAGTYSFNWSKPKGEYVIVLCNGATREIVIGGKTRMIAITIGLTALIFMLFYVATRIQSKNWWLSGAKTLLVVTGLVFTIYLIPASFLMENFTNKLWIYVMWLVRVYAAYALLGLVSYVFKKWDLIRKVKL